MYKCCILTGNLLSKNEMAGDELNQVDDVGVMWGQLVALLDGLVVTRFNIPKVPIFHFKGDKVSEWLELLEQITDEMTEEEKFRRISKYVWWEMRPEVRRIATEAAGNWGNFKAEMQRRYQLGDDLLTTEDLERLERSDFTTFKRETLAVFHYLRVFRNYLFGRRFVLRVDPTTLADSLKNYAPSDPTIARWLTYVWMFDFELERIPGNKNRADELSRINWDKSGDGANEDIPPVDAFLDEEEDVKLHINAHAVGVSGVIVQGQSAFLTPAGYVKRADIVLKDFMEEDPWGGKEVEWMAKLALTETFQLREDPLAIESGAYSLNTHAKFVVDVSFLVNSIVQVHEDGEGSRDPVRDMEEDEFEEGEVTEVFRADEYEGVYSELGLLLSCEIRERETTKKVLEMRPCFLVRDGHLFIKNEVGNLRRVICGRNRQIDVIVALHDGPADGHRAFALTYAKARELYYWEGMSEMIHKYCESCIPCQIRASTMYKEPLHPRIVRDAQVVVHLDLLAMPQRVGGYNYIFDARDNLTGFVDGRAIRSKTGKTLVLCISEYFLRVGFSKLAIIWRGGRMVGQEDERLATSLILDPFRYGGGHVFPFLDGLVRQVWILQLDFAQMTERVRGTGSYEERVAQIVRESLDWRQFARRMLRLQPQPIDRQGRPIRFDGANLDEFLEVFVIFGDGQRWAEAQRVRQVRHWVVPDLRHEVSTMSHMVQAWAELIATLRGAFTTDRRRRLRREVGDYIPELRVRQRAQLERDEVDEGRSRERRRESGQPEIPRRPRTGRRRGRQDRGDDLEERDQVLTSDVGKVLPTYDLGVETLPIGSQRQDDSSIPEIGTSPLPETCPTKVGISGCDPRDAPDVDEGAQPMIGQDGEEATPRLVLTIASARPTETDTMEGVVPNTASERPYRWRDTRDMALDLPQRELPLMIGSATIVPMQEHEGPQPEWPRETTPMHGELGHDGQRVQSRSEPATAASMRGHIEVGAEHTQDASPTHEEESLPESRGPIGHEPVKRDAWLAERMGQMPSLHFPGWLAFERLGLAARPHLPVDQTTGGLRVLYDDLTLQRTYIGSGLVAARQATEQVRDYTGRVAIRSFELSCGRQMKHDVLREEVSDLCTFVEGREVQTLEEAEAVLGIQEREASDWRAQVQRVLREYEPPADATNRDRLERRVVLETVRSSADATNRDRLERRVVLETVRSSQLESQVSTLVRLRRETEEQTQRLFFEDAATAGWQEEVRMRRRTGEEPMPEGERTQVEEGLQARLLSNASVRELVGVMEHVRRLT
ncbi:hypothetical protein CBR_g21996 [Chara braunii]|uniref:Integrase zinc-binding domain-containing protein n=1 Tax=Chara braunii TaxID=69332 RepID=A0A388L1W3_CHABU|nr:hypothetical protein CBR_g21996 [Chara braunii]|eukprot:GBG76248.1 hypothetical protein CBR_g21996 [Chara braunii]